MKYNIKTKNKVKKEREKEMSGCYQMYARCGNCGFCQMISIKKGTFIHNTLCPNCGTYSLEKGL